MDKITKTVSSSKYQTMSPAIPRQSDGIVDQYLEKLKQDHPELKIEIGSITNQSQIKDLALSQKGLYHVLIDPEILEQMAKDETVRKKYETILNKLAKQQEHLANQANLTGKKVISIGTVIGSDGKVSTYTAAMEEKKEQYPVPADSFYGQSYLTGTSSKPKITVQYKFNYGNQMTRLAQAKSISNVRGVIHSQYQEISRAKFLISDANQSAMTVTKIKAVIQKGNIKISRLRKEEMLVQRNKIAVKMQKARLARELQEEIRGRRAARKGQEHCDTIDMGGALENRSEAQLKYEQAIKEYQLDLPGNIGGDMTSGGMVSGPQGGVTAGIEVSIDVSV